jgi:hypothetical protein
MIWISILNVETSQMNVAKVGESNDGLQGIHVNVPFRETSICRIDVSLSNCHSSENTEDRRPWIIDVSDLNI